MKEKLLVLCTGNSARSQMAEGLFRHFLGDRFEVASAGTKPSIVRPEAIAVMAELGIDLSGHRSKSVEEFLADKFRFVVTVCDNARETCPVLPGAGEFVHWSFEDPAAVVGSEDERRAAFRKIRDEIQAKVKAFAATL